MDSFCPHPSVAIIIKLIFSNSSGTFFRRVARAYVQLPQRNFSTHTLTNYTSREIETWTLHSFSFLFNDAVFSFLFCGDDNIGESARGNTSRNNNTISNDLFCASFFNCSSRCIQPVKYIISIRR